MSQEPSPATNGSSLWAAFDLAYKMACASSQPSDWMEAALIAQQIRYETTLSETLCKPVAWYRIENVGRVYYETEAWSDMTPLYETPVSAIAPTALELAEQWKGRADDAGLLARAILNG